MKIIIVLIGILIFYRASNLAQGKKLKKIFKAESFLFWQKILAIYFVGISIYYLLIGEIYFFWFFLANLILVGLFYLQPTPRTTRSLQFGFIILNLIVLLIIFS